jgi:flagellar hook-associated protein 2
VGIISFSGLASGLDTSSIISQLVALERIPIQIMEYNQAAEQTKLDLVGTFKGFVQSLQSKAQELSTMDSLYSFAVESSQDGLASISAGSGAQAGTHTLTVNAMATTDRWAFDGVVDPDADLGTVDGQSVSFDVNGNSYNIAFNAADSSLNEIAAEINSQAGDDVSASVINAGTSSNPDWQLVLASDSTGVDARVTNLASAVAGLTLSDPAVGGSNNVVVGENASATVDGILVERTDNDFSDVIQGVSLSLLSADPGNEMSFTVSADKEAIKTKVQEFVDAYNEVINFVNAQNTYDEDSGAGGELFGDSILTSVRGEVQRALYDVDLDEVLNDPDGFSTMSLIGIDTNSDGTLTIDSATLDSKMDENLALFSDLFADTDGFDNGGAAPNTSDYYTDTTADTGLADRLYRAIDHMFGTFEGPPDPGNPGENIVLDGLFDARTDAINGNIERFTKQIEGAEWRLEMFEQNLVARFATLEEVMGQLQAQGAALSNALLSLPGSSNS